MRPVEANDELNTPVATWPVVATRSAGRRDVSSGERLRAEQLGSTIDTRFRILRDSQIAGLDPTWRLSDRGRVYEITGVRELGVDGRELELDCVALATPDGIGG
jgi:head-tail adaptor